MTAFRFRLDRVLEWREIERRLAAGRVETAEAALRKARDEHTMIQQALARGPEANPTGNALANWGGWRSTLIRHLRGAEQRVAAAQAALEKEQAALVEATRRVKLLFNLKADQLTVWRRDLEREMSAFANDLHLGRISRLRLQSTKAGA
jgi:flagellar export protein FliJ